MGTTTTNYGLYKPALNETGWDTSVNGNFDIIDAALAATGGVSVKAAPFAAVGDGVADDTTEIQAALTAVQAAGGGKVFIPRGTYKISAQLTVGADTCVEGAARGVTQISSTHAGTAMFFGTTNVGTDSPPTVRSTLRDITFDGPGRSTGSVGVQVRKCKRMFMQNVAITDYEKGLYVDPGDAGGWCTGGTYEHVMATDNTYQIVLGNELSTAAECTDNKFYSCYCSADDDGTHGYVGIWVKRGNTNNFLSCSVEGVDHGYLLGNTTAASSTGFLAARNTFVTCRAENTKRNEGLITAGTDNQVFGGSVSFHDRANAATNRVIGISQPVDDSLTGVSSTLSVAMTAALTNQTITLASGTGFPQPSGRGVGVVKIQSEYIMYETRATSPGNVLTLCYRGCWGSTVATHAIGTVVSEVGQGNEVRMVQTVEPQEGKPTGSDAQRGQIIWESGDNTETDALWLHLKGKDQAFYWQALGVAVGAGAPADTDFRSVPDAGTLYLNKTTNQVYVRTTVANTWAALN